MSILDRLANAANALLGVNRAQHGRSVGEFEGVRVELTPRDKARVAELRAVLARIAAGKPARELTPEIAQHHLELAQKAAEVAIQDDDKEAERERR